MSLERSYFFLGYLLQTQCNSITKGNRLSSESLFVLLERIVLYVHMLNMYKMKYKFKLNLMQIKSDQN